MLNQNKTIRLGVIFILIFIILIGFLSLYSTTLSTLGKEIKVIYILLYNFGFAFIVSLVKIRYLKSLFNFQLPSTWDEKFKKFTAIFSEIYAELVLLNLAAKFLSPLIARFLAGIFKPIFSEKTLPSLLFLKNIKIADILGYTLSMSVLLFIFIIFTLLINGILINLLGSDDQRAGNVKSIIVLTLILPIMYLAFTFTILLARTIF